MQYVWLVVRQLLVALLLTQGYYRDQNSIVYLHIVMGQINPDGFHPQNVMIYFCIFF